jgi:cephalosporin hydroxylase
MFEAVAQFEAEKRASIASYDRDAEWQELSSRWMERAFRQRYMYNFLWMDRPIIQIPTDMVAIQELIWSVKPDLIIETGIAHGGSLVFSASILALLELDDALREGRVVDPARPKRIVAGIELELREHNRAALEAHPMRPRIRLLEGSSLDEKIIGQASELAREARAVMVFLDSNHTHDHVLAELEAYAPLVSRGSHCVVFDTIVEDLPADVFPDRPWAPGNSPKSAVMTFLERLGSEGRTASDGEALRFERDAELEAKLLLSVAPHGYLRRL